MFMPTKLELPKGEIGPKFVRRIMPFVELYYSRQGRYPSDVDLADHFGFTHLDLERIHASKFYNNCLRNRGIVRNNRTGQFSPEQLAAITLITNFSDPRSPDAKLASIGVSPEMYNGWMQSADFKRELQRRADDVLDNVYPEAQTALAQKVRQGNVQALRFYYELTGRVQTAEVVNVKLVMVKMIEAVQKHVRDPEILQAIAAELSGVMPGMIEAEPPPVAASNVKSIKQIYSEAEVR